MRNQLRFLKLLLVIVAGSSVSAQLTSNPTAQRYLQFLVCGTFTRQLDGVLDGIAIAQLLNATAVLPMWYATTGQASPYVQHDPQATDAVDMGAFWDVAGLEQRLQESGIRVVRELPTYLQGDPTGEGDSTALGAAQRQWRVGSVISGSSGSLAQSNPGRDLTHAMNVSQED